MHATPSTPALARSPTGASERHAWGIVFLLFLAYTLSFVDRQILTLMVDPIRRDLQLSDTQFSLLHGLAFALFYTFLGLPLGRVADRFDRHRLIAAGVAMWSLMTAGCGLARNFWQLFLARMGVGVGEAALSPAAFSMFADLFTRDRLPRAISAYSMGIAAGSGLALLLGGFVVEFATGVGEISVPLVGTLRPWQLVFVIIGMAGLPLALVILQIREPERREKIEKHVSVADVWSFIRERKGLFLCLLGGLSIATAFGHGVHGWAPAYLMRVHGWAPEEVGLRYGAPIVFTGAAGLLLGSWLTERFHRRGHQDAPLRAAVIGIALCAPLGASAALSSHGGVAVVLLALVQFAYMLPWGVVGAAFQWIAPNEMRGQISALYLFCINIIGLGLGPTFVATLSDRVYGGPMGVGYSLATAACVLIPIAAGLILLALPGYRDAVHRARAWSGQPAPV